MPLTDTAIRNAKPGEKPTRLFDGGGLYLEVAPAGGKWWRLKYRFEGKEKRISLGVYPAVGLREARGRRDEARRFLADRIDPSAQRLAQKHEAAGQDSFEAVAREWFSKYSTTWVPGTARVAISRLERLVFPSLGRSPVRQITTPELLAVLRRIESAGRIETAHRTLQLCGRVLRYAVATGRAERDPSGDLRGALTPAMRKHFRAILDPRELGGLLRAVDDYRGTPEVRAAVRLAPLLFVRPGELRRAEWVEVDFEAASWSIPALKTKTREPHIVPLCDQAGDILRDLHALTGRGRFLFPSMRNVGGPMSANAINAALGRLGYGAELVAHSFRATARTLLDEALGFPPHLIEHQLAHAVRDPLGRAYNRTAHLAERRRMMQAWGDYLDGLKNGAEVVALRSARPG